MTEPEGFTEFWSAFPKKVSRVAAMDAFRWAMAHFNEDGQLLTRMLETLAWQATFYGRRWIKEPDKWLLQQRWTDENPSAAPALDPLYPQYERWRETHGAEAVTITFDQFKAYAQKGRRSA